MISKLAGIVDCAREGFVVLDVNGVGYGVHAPAGAVMAPGSPLSLYIETVVREDSITLYGFGSEAERGLFNLLNTVQGVGPKAAMSILSTLSARQIAAAVASGDAKTLSGAPGIGAKTAARIASELKDKLAKSGIALELGEISGMPKGSGGLVEDALSALANMGYARTQAFEVVMKICSRDPNLALDGLIKAALRELGTL